MPRPKEEVAMDKALHLRVSRDQYERLRRIAHATGLTVSDLLRRSSMHAKIPNATEGRILTALISLRNELRRQGGLLKHAINSFQDFDEFEEAIAAFKTAANACEKAAYQADKLYTEYRNAKK